MTWADLHPIQPTDEPASRHELAGQPASAEPRRTHWPLALQAAAAAQSVSMQVVK